MKKPDLSQTVSILANLGVIAGIIFLAFELQQNNELLRAEARANQLEARRGSSLQLTTNPQLATIVYKLGNDESVTSEERYQFTWLARDLFVRWQWQFEEYQQGLIEEESLPVGGWVNWFREIPVMKDEWATSGRTGSPEFRQFMEDNVVNAR